MVLLLFIVCWCLVVWAVWCRVVLRGELAVSRMVC